MDYLKRKSSWIWIGEDYDKENPIVVWFRKECELSEKPQRAVCRISADSRYRFYVNGHSVCQGPCKGDGQVWYYDEVDFAPYLEQGRNVLAAVVLRYPRLHSNGNHSVWRTETPGFYFQCTDAAGEAGGKLSGNGGWLFHTADSVRIRKSNPYFEPLCITEEACGEKEFAGWRNAGYNSASAGENAWKPAIPYFHVGEYVSPGLLLPRPIPFLYERRRGFKEVMCVREGTLSKEEWSAFLRRPDRTEAKGLTVPPHSRQMVELHAGELTTGYLEWKLAQGAGSRITLICSESYVYPQPDAEGPAAFFSVKKGDRLDWQNGILSGPQDVYRPGGFGTEAEPEQYEPFWFRTFRFLRLEIETGEEPLILCSLTYRETGYPLEVGTHVETSDSGFSDIWEICERTLRRCMHETYEDCPYYEQLQYIMDTRSQILFTYMTSADDRLARKCIEDFARSQRFDGLLEGCYPSYGPNTICNFSIYYILMVDDHYRFFGDREFTKRFLPVLWRILQFFGSRLTEQGLVRRTTKGGQEGHYWSFIDWVDRWDRGVPGAIAQGDVTMESLLYLLGLKTASALFRDLGYPDVAGEQERKADELKKAIQEHCTDSNGLLLDGPGFPEYSQHCQTFGVLTGVLEGEEASHALHQALTDSSFAKCSVAMAYYLFRALERTGLYEKTDGLWNLWRDMVKANLTTCVENDGLSGRSDCHAWGALALYELPAVVLGVRPGKPGFEEIQVRPVPGFLDWARGDVITPKGTVHVEWSREADGTLRTEVSGPDGIRIVS